MRVLSTGLGAWDTIARDTQGTHGITFPLALVHAAIEEAGYPAPVCAEGDGAPEPGGERWGALMLSALDSRHYWRVPDFLRRWGVPVWSAERGASDPIVILGGQAAYAPAPVEEIVDVVYVGEAEGGIGELMAVLHSGLSRRQILERLAAIPHCMVPAVQAPGRVTVAHYAADIALSLRRRLDVNLRTIHRIEVARGCKGPAYRTSDKGNAACGFCALGWRAPYRENSAAAVGAAIRASGVSEVHLSAGDAEGHSEIEAIRQEVAHLGVRDHGWTGRVDTVKDCSVAAGKHFAFGLEGPSMRLRRAVGKGRLTEDYVAEKIAAYWAAGGRRMMLHLIGNLPTESEDDVEELDALLWRLRGVAAGMGTRLSVDIGRQPFGPLPHTPMQWFRPGLSTRRIGAVVERWEQDPALHITHKSGQSYRAALYAAITMRGGREVGPLLVRGAPRLPEGRGARRAMARWLGTERVERYLGDWEIGSPTPWDHVQVAHREHVVGAARRVARVLGVAV